MCGILAYYDTKSNSTPHSLARGLDSMNHRGPDGQGTFRRGGVYLGHRRLKIIDLSARADQPMSTPDGRYWIVFNGEIYNYKRLRERLEQNGHRFRTQSDTEVLLRAYLEYREDCLSYLDGMFAFVVLDSHTESFFAARDRLGIKPLYYTWDGRVFAAASEVRALLTAGLVQEGIDESALLDYLTLGSVQSPNTILKSIRALMPGCYLTISGGALREVEYWAPPFIPETEKQHVEVDAASAQVSQILEDALDIHTISDVPLGVFLSGGIDSGAIVALMSRIGAASIKTFSIGFDVGGESYNETPFARMVADRYHTEHHEYVLTSGDIVQEFPRFVEALDQPSCDGLNSYFVSKFARDYVTVCLSGLGGDEVFAGYGWMRFLYAVRAMKNGSSFLPKSVLRGMLNTSERLPQGVRRSRFVRLLLGATGAWSNSGEIQRHFRRQFSRIELKRLLTLHCDVEDQFNDFAEKTERLAAIDAACFLDQSTYLHNTLLRDMDTMSMAHSLEARVPLLDYRLVEYVARLPSAVKYRLNEPKYLLRHVVSGLLPEALFDRKKTGFTFPLAIWMHEPQMREVVHDCLSPSGLGSRGLFESRYLSKLLRNGLHEDPRRRNPFVHHQLWLLTILELWLRERSSAARKRSSEVSLAQ